MPAALIVDPTTLDLSRVVMTKDQIHELLPHRDEMSFLDAVIHRDIAAGILAAVMRVPQKAFWTSGHFPANPILPGIVLIEAAAQTCLVFYKICVPEVRNKLVLFGGVDEVRFRGSVRPGDTVVLVTKLITATPRGGRNATQAYLNGKLIFEAIIFAVAT